MKTLTKDLCSMEHESEAERTDPAIFDRAHLRQYTNGSEALERELIGLFLGQLAPIRAQLDAASSENDWKFAAHTLKGSARSIGAPRIAALAEELELIGYEGAAETKAQLLAELEQAMAAFTGAAERVLAG